MCLLQARPSPRLGACYVVDSRGLFKMLVGITEQKTFGCLSANSFEQRAFYRPFMWDMFDIETVDCGYRQCPWLPSGALPHQESRAATWLKQKTTGLTTLC